MARRNVLEIDAEFAAIDDGNAPTPTCGGDRLDRLGEIQRLGSRGVRIDHQRVDMDKKRAVGRNGLDDAVEPGGRKSRVERKHARMQLGIDRVVAKLDAEGDVAARDCPGEGGGMTLRATL
jgi:hypothetical protein